MRTRSDPAAACAAPALPGGRGAVCELSWLALLDRLYGLVELRCGLRATGLHLRAGSDGAWQTLLDEFAGCLGARAIRLVGEDTRDGTSPTAAQAPKAGRCLVRQRAPSSLAGVAWIDMECADAWGFSEAQMRKFRAFCSHLGTACTVDASLDAAQSELESWYEVFETLPLPLAVLDETLHLHSVNRAARRLLAGAPLLDVWGSAGLQGDASVQATLREFAADVSSDRRRLVMGGIEVEMRKLPTRSFMPEACAAGVSVLLLFRDWQGQRAGGSLSPLPAKLAVGLRERHGLSERELPVAWNIALGMSPKEYAALSGRSIETVRAQLKSVYRKLGVGGQSPLTLRVFDALGMTHWQAAARQMGEDLIASVAAAPRDAAEARWVGA